MRAYREALERGRAAGAAHADDEALLAMVCQHDIQMFAGARETGIDARTLIGMPSRDIAELQWL